MSIESLLIAAFAVYRLTLMLNSENGPGDIFSRFRTWIGVEFDQYTKPYGSNWLAEGVLCFYCLSVWFGIAATVLIVVAGLLGHVEIGIILLAPFALSGVAVFLKKWTG